VSFDRKSDVGYVPAYPPPQDLSAVPTAGRYPAFYVLKVQIDVLSVTTGGTPQALYTNQVLCRKLTIQNITTTAATLVTVFSEYGSSNGIKGTADDGVQLNAGSAQDVGGGSISFGDTADPRALIDASKFYWTATNSSDQISVILEIPGERLY
jgi:hypothetical protein